MAKGRMQFLINSSYTMDEVDDDDPPAAPPPQSKDENQEEPSSPPAEEKKSDNNSIVDSDVVRNLTCEKQQQSQEIIIDAETTTKTAEAAPIITPQSSNLHDDQSSSQIIIEDSSKIAAAAIETSDELPIKSAMAMVKLRVWDPAAPSQQFKCISATTVLLLPRDSRCNISDSVDIDDSDLTNDANYMNLVTTSNRKYRDDRNQKRLSVVEEERRTVSGRSILCDDENNDNATVATSASDVNADSTLLDDYHHAILNGAESQRQQERRETVKIANKSVKNNLSQLVEENVDDDDDANNNLHVGSLVGIHLIKKKSPSSSSLSSATNTSAASSVVSDNARTNKQQEWKVGNSIRVLHNLNLIPLHTAGLERLLYQIEHNDPSLRELILDGITSTLSTKHLEILIEAIGTNTSIKKCSLQHSQITNEIASTLALALVDNTTLTTLSLRGNDLTNVAVKNFYSVLSSGNRSLRVLDITNNPRIEEDIREAFETFMEQRAVKRMLQLRAEKAKRIAKGMPLLNEMLEEESEDDWRIGSGDDGRRRSGGVTVVCHPDIIDGNVPDSNVEAVPQLQQSSSTGNSFDTYQQSEGSASRPDEEVRGCYDSVLSDITGVTGMGNESRATSPRESRSAFDSPSPQQQQQRQQQQQQQASYLSQSIGSELYPHSQQQHEEEQEPMIMSSPQRSNRHFDPNYSMASSQISSNDSSTSNTGNESLDQRQRQQLATINDNNNNNSSSRRNSNNFRSSNTSSRNSLQVSAEDYFDPKATERELRRQLATQGQAIGAYAIDDEAPHRQEVRGRRARVSRSESQRRARLLELSGSAPPSAAGGSGAVNTDIEGGDNLVDADIERIEDYEYRNLSLYRKFFYKIGLDGDDNKTDRVICLTFGVCILVLLVAIILYVAKG